MKNEMDWENRFKKEIQTAKAARSQGNEGKARVCARRATGIVLREYFSRQQISCTSSTAYSVLQSARELPEIPPEARQVIDHFLLRVNPDHQLPVEIDLIAEASWLAEILLPNLSPKI